MSIMGAYTPISLSKFAIKSLARLYPSPPFFQQSQPPFAGDFKISYNLAPPILPGRDPSDRPTKLEFGPWMLSAFKLLRKLKGLRGTPFDIFGYFPERRMERRLIGEYRSIIESTTRQLGESNCEIGIHIAAAAFDIGG